MDLHGLRIQRNGDDRAGLTRRWECARRIGEGLLNSQLLRMTGCRTIAMRRTRDRGSGVFGTAADASREREPWSRQTLTLPKRSRGDCLTRPAGKSKVLLMLGSFSRVVQPSQALRRRRTFCSQFPDRRRAGSRRACALTAASV